MKSMAKNFFLCPHVFPFLRLECFVNFSKCWFDGRYNVEHVRPPGLNILFLLQEHTTAIQIKYFSRETFAFLQSKTDLSIAPGLCGCVRCKKPENRQTDFFEIGRKLLEEHFDQFVTSGYLYDHQKPVKDNLRESFWFFDRTQNNNFFLKEKK